MTLLSRRSFLAGVTSLTAAGAAYAQTSRPQAGPMTFRIMRDGSDIGSQTVNFDRNQDVLAVKIVVDIVVKLGPITLYHYQQNHLERWKGDQFQNAETNTSDDGTNLVVSMRRQGDQIIVESTKSGDQFAPLTASPATYWNKRSLNFPMIGIEDGRILTPSVIAQGWEQVPSLSGTRIDAQHFVLAGDVAADAWYDHNDQWRSLRLHARDGSLIQYVIA